MIKDLIERAYEAKFAADYVLAKELLEECLVQCPDNAEALRERALLFYREKNFSKAKEFVTKSLDIEESFWGHLYLARILDKLNDASASEKEFVIAAKSAPNQDSQQIVSRFYAVFLASKSRFQEAKDQAISALPFFADEPRETNYLNKIINYCRLKSELHTPTIAPGLPKNK